jgi:hypothetical protein
MAAPRKRIRGKRARLKQQPRGFNLRKQHRALAFAAAEAHLDWEFVSEGGLRYTGKRTGQHRRFVDAVRVGLQKKLGRPSATLE